MKTTIASRLSVWLVILFISIQSICIAQETTATGIKNDAKHFLSQPWVWAVGAVLVLIILIALFSGGSRKHKQVIRTTVIKEQEEI